MVRLKVKKAEKETVLDRDLHSNMVRLKAKVMIPSVVILKIYIPIWFD